MFENKNNEDSDYIEDIDVGDEKPHDGEEDDIRCTTCSRTFSTVHQFLQHREHCNIHDGDGQPSSG